MSTFLNDLFPKLDPKDDKSLELLANAFEKANIPGFDYVEFKKSMNGLEKLDFESNKAIISAYTTASTMGLTKDKLLESIQHYIGRLGKEREAFGDAVKRQIEVHVTAKRNEKIHIAKEIDQLNEQVKNLQQKINQHQSKLDSADERINEAESKIADRKKRFEATFSQITAVLEDDYKLINTTL